jgi:regulation of enolase protein 1 (concanavalin A-like superfamily)
VKTIAIKALPHSLESFHALDSEVIVVEEGVNKDQKVTIRARAGDDLFCEPGRIGTVNGANLFVMPVEGDFRLQARVRVEFNEQYDSAVLVGYFNAEHWFKLCAERDTHAHTRVVSVVTRNRSDDCNGMYFQTPSIFLRICRSSGTFCLYSSLDGENWDLVRYFDMGEISREPMRIGLAAQSPNGRGTVCTFDRIAFSADSVHDVRGGK